MFHKTVCLLCCAMLLMTAPMAAQADATYRMAGFDGDSSSHTWESNDFFTRMQARTGISFTFDEYTDASKWQTAKQTMFASGDLPDVLFKAALTTREQIEYHQKGMLLDLKPLLAENAPHLWALLTAHPDWLADITLPDGSIVALPTINEQSVQNAMWINREWLDTLKLDAPTDWDSLVTVLRAFATGDPNQNGKADEIPLAFLGTWDLKFLAHSVGLVANDYNLYLDENGTVTFMPDQDAYLTLVARLADLYAEGLMDPQGFYTADSLRTVTDDDAVMTYGLFFGPNPMNLLPYAAASQYELLMPLRYEGKQIYRDFNGCLMRGTFAITSACADPAALLAWVDQLYTEDGAIEAMAGTEGTDYTVDADGHWTYAKDLENNSSYLLYDMSIYDTGDMPWLFPLEFYNRYVNEDISRVNQQLAALQQLVVQPFPVCTLTPEQEDEIAPIQAELGRYVDESMARMILGEWDAHDPQTLSAYRQGLKDHGQDALVAFWQGIADNLSK